MGTKGNDVVKRAINFDRWVFDAVDEISKKKKMTFTYVLHELLRPQLAHEGYTSGIGENSPNAVEAKKGA